MQAEVELTQKPTTCGVIVSDGTSLLLGHATRSPRWDIPKGLADPGEAFLAAAVRELREETGLAVDPALLQDLGVHPYLPHKDLALFAWHPVPLPDPATLHCDSMVHPAAGPPFPEFDRFGLFPWDDALSRVGRGMAVILARLRPP